MFCNGVSIIFEPSSVCLRADAAGMPLLDLLNDADAGGENGNGDDNADADEQELPPEPAALHPPPPPRQEASSAAATAEAAAWNYVSEVSRTEISRVRSIAAKARSHQSYEKAQRVASARRTVTKRTEGDQVRKAREPTFAEDVVSMTFGPWFCFYRLLDMMR